MFDLLKGKLQNEGIFLWTECLCSMYYLISFTDCVKLGARIYIDFNFNLFTSIFDHNVGRYFLERLILQSVSKAVFCEAPNQLPLPYKRIAPTRVLFC